MLRVAQRVTADAARSLHTAARASAGQKYRVMNGKARSGNEYGTLTDTPDWSYLDGRPAPSSLRQLKRSEKQQFVQLRMAQLLQEVNNATQPIPAKAPKSA
eukprot:m.110894 g.110894  ORF g.110894 m.110894 type:complete len:101 (-) comp15932_c0_seq3:137-439(-)